MTGPEILIHEGAFVRNFRALQKLAGSLALMPVIKANAYGHGAEIIAKICEARFSESEAPMLVVARACEAVALRSAGVRRPLLVLSEFSEEDFESGWPTRTEVVLQDAADATLLESAKARGRDLPSGIHFELNTGMNRLGFRVDRELANTLSQVSERLKACGIPVTGLMTHLARGEEDPVLLSYEQERLFAETVDRLRAAWDASKCGPFPKCLHAANSPGIIRGIGVARLTAARPGVLLWGTFATIKDRALAASSGQDFRGVAEVRAPLRQLFWAEAGEGVGYGHRYVCARRTLLGTVALGYADGVSRSLSRGASDSWSVGFVVDGTRVPVAGTVSMDLTMVDLTDHPSRAHWESQLARGERPEITAYWICPQQTAEDLAERLGTISYEVLCALSERLPRRLVKEAA